MASQSLGTLSVDLVANTGSLESGFKKAEAGTKRLTGETKKQQAELQNLIGQIDPVVAAYSRLDKMEEQLRKHRQSGLLPDEDFQQFARQIDAQRVAVEKNSQAYAGNSKTARELSFAMRNLPAQLTDIAVGIQGGQRPLTILLQQGGQLKDMFGGIGPALRFFGTYILGLINPINIAAVALGTLAFGYLKGEKEAQNFNKALVLTGQSANITSAQLSVMAAEIDNVVGTQAKASAVLVEIVETGKIAKEAYQEIATAAIAFEEATGQATEETIKNFAKLYDDPAEASAELNEQYGYLTASTYAQIAALQEEGLTAEATALAVSELKNAHNEMAANIDQNLGFVGKGWNAIKNVVSEVADAIANVGRQDPLERFDALSLMLNRPELYSEERIAAAREERELLAQQLGYHEFITGATEDQVRINKEAIAAQRILNAELAETASDAEKLQKELEKIDELVAQAAAGGVEYTQAQIELLRAAVTEEFSKGAQNSLDAADKLLEKAREQQALLLAQETATRELTSTQQELIKFENQIAEIKSKKVLTADEEIILAQEDQIRNQLEINVSIQEGLRWREREEKAITDFNKVYASLLTKEEASVANTLEKLNLLEAARAAGLDQLKYAEALNRILKQSFTSIPDFTSLIGRTGDSVVDRFAKASRELDDWYNSQLEMLDQFREERADKVEEWDRRELEITRQYNETAAALEKAKLSQRNDQFDEFAKEAARNMQDAFADFLFDPFDEGLDGMVKNFGDALKRMAAEAAAAEILESIGNSNIFQKALSWVGGLFGGGSTTGAISTLGAEYLKMSGVSVGSTGGSLGSIGSSIGSGIQSIPVIGWIAGGILNELNARNSGARDENTVDYLQDLFGGKVLEQDVSKGWIADIAARIFGDDQYGFYGDMKFAADLMSLDISNAFENFENTSLGKLLGLGDGYERQNAGFLAAPTPGAKPEYTFEVDPFASGLEVTGFARRAGQDAANEVIDQFRSIDAFFVEATKAMGGILEVTQLVGLDEEATPGSVGTLFGLGRDADLPAQMKLFIDQLADNMVGLDESLIESIKSAADAEAAITALTEALVLYDSRIRELRGLAGNMDAIQQARDEFELNKGLVAVYERSTSAVIELSGAYEGTLAQTNVMIEAINMQQDALYNLTLMYLQAQVAVESLFGNLSESIRKSLMGQEELYNYEREQVHALTAMLNTLTDPEAILATAQDIERRVSEMWGRLDETQREEMGAGFLAYLDEVEDLAQQRLSEGLAEVEDAQAQFNENLLARVEAVTADLGIVAERFGLSSDINLQASQINLQAAEIEDSTARRNLLEANA